MATSETVNFDVNTPFGPGATIASSAEDFYAEFDGGYDISNQWQLNGGALYGRDNSPQFN